MRIAVDSWVQQVTCVSFVFHSGIGQQAFRGVMPPTPTHPSAPSCPLTPVTSPPTPPFFFSLQELAFDRRSAGQPDAWKNPGAAAVAAAMHSERMCAAGYSERIAFVTEETLSLMSLDGHEFSHDQKLPYSQTYPPPPWTCSVAKTIQRDSPWTCNKSGLFFQSDLFTVTHLT